MAPVATSSLDVFPEFAPGKPDQDKSVKNNLKDKNVYPRPPAFADKHEERAYLKFRLAQAFRIFAKLGYSEGIAGHITVRDPIKPDCFWVNPFGMHFALIQPEDLMLVEHTGTVIEAGPTTRLLNPAAFAIHTAVHAARADVLCVAHTHSVHGRAYAALGRELDMITQDACAFYHDHAVYKLFNGVVLAEEEGARIAQALGTKKALILQNHGLLVATPSIEGTLYYYTALENNCRVQLLADAAGASVKIPDAQARDTYATIGTVFGGWFSGRPAFQLLEKEEGVLFEYQPKEQ